VFWWCSWNAIVVYVPLFREEFIIMVLDENDWFFLNHFVILIFPFYHCKRLQ
jgi:hypothetical protein